MGYDSRCYDLATVFLAEYPEKNTEENRDKLAQHIQTEIESEIEFILEPVAKPDWVEQEDAKQIGRQALRAAGLPHSGE